MCQPRPYFFPEPVQSSRKCRKPSSPPSGMCMCTVKQAAPPGAFLKSLAAYSKPSFSKGTSAFDTVFSRNLPFLCQSSLFSYDNRWAHVSRHAHEGGDGCRVSQHFLFFLPRLFLLDLLSLDEAQAGKAPQELRTEYAGESLLSTRNPKNYSINNATSVKQYIRYEGEQAITLQVTFVLFALTKK